MKNQVLHKYLLNTFSTSNIKGFTLIELLVVIVIIGILSAIALPSFINQANKAREAEARTYVSAMNSAQTVFYLEQSEFSTSFDTLNIGIPQETASYNYEIEALDATVRVVNNALPKNSSLLAPISGTVYTILTPEGALTQAVLCKGIAGQPLDLSAVNTVSQCPSPTP